MKGDIFMSHDTWIDEMIRDIESKKEKEPDVKTVKLSESDMNTLADLMIKKMSESDFDAESQKSDDKDDATDNPKPDASGEIPIE